jgi:hypothetical protein
LPHPDNPNYSCYLVDGNFTGLMIIPKYYDYSPQLVGPPRTSKPERTVYKVEYLPDGKTVAEVDRFRQAIRLGESYYAERKAVNANGTVPK